MFTPKPRGWWVRAAVAAALAGACVIVACTADIPSGPGAGPAANVATAPRFDSPDFAYEPAVLSRVPELSNQREIFGIMEQLYPSLLQKAGIGGTTVVQLVIQPDGTVDPGSIRVLQSGNDELAAASVAAVRAFRFRPGQYKGENVRVLIQMPIAWQPKSAAAARSSNPDRVEVLKAESQAVSPIVDLAASRTAAPAQGEPDFAYETRVLDRVPELMNKAEIGGLMDSLYPSALRAAGITGTVVLQFVIEPDGTADMRSAKVLESGRPELSEASLKMLERFRFRPGVYKGENVRVLIQMPITWQPKV